MECLDDNVRKSKSAKTHRYLICFTPKNEYTYNRYAHFIKKKSRFVQIQNDRITINFIIMLL